MALPKRFHDDANAGTNGLPVSSDAISRVRRGERVTILGEDDHPVAALVPLADLRRLEADDARRERARQEILAFGELFADEEPADLERRVAAAVAQARAELRAEWDADGG
jgi:antitoxin (DNA-binding transcriptional repressor) of toxin-antitoxin stability system